MSFPGMVKHSFGDASTNELPFISFPLSSIMTVTTVSNEGDESNSSLHNDDDDDSYWKSNRTYKMISETQYIDLAAWKIIYPFDVPLSSFWGEGTPAQLMIYHDQVIEESNDSNMNDNDDGDDNDEEYSNDSNENTKRTYLLQLQLTPETSEEK